MTKEEYLAVGQICQAYINALYATKDNDIPLVTQNLKVVAQILNDLEIDS